jgi:hypothetical protein
MSVGDDEQIDCARQHTSNMSTPEREKDLHEVLEAVCRRGCRYVLQVIAALERGEIPEDLSGLDLVLRQRVLAELQAIMAVYDRECSLVTGSPVTELFELDNKSRAPKV